MQRPAGRHLAVFALLLWLAGAAAAETVDYSRASHWSGVVTLPGTIEGLSAVDGRVYVSCADGRLYTVDVTDPANPLVAHATSLPYGDEVLLGRDGNVLYLGGSLGLTACDVSSGGEPVLLGTTDGLADIQDIAVEHKTAVLAGPSGLILTDVSDPAGIAILGSYSTRAREVAIQGDRAYALDWSGYATSVQVFDISDPGTPAFLFGFDDPFQGKSTIYDIFCRDVAVHDGRTFTVRNYWTYDSGGGGTTRRSELRLWDLSDENSPTLVDTWNVSSFRNPRHTTLAGSDLVQTLSDGSFAVVDLLNAAPVVDLRYRIEPSLDLICISDGVVAASDGNVNLHVFALGDRTFGHLRAGVSGWVKAALVEDDLLLRRAYISDPYYSESTLVLTDIADPENPVLQKTYYVPSRQYDRISADQHRFYLSGDGLQACGRQPETPFQEVDTVTLDFVPVDALHGLAAAGASGLIVYNLPATAPMAAVGTLATDSYVKVASLESGLVLAVTEAGEIHQIDLSVPAAPAVGGRIGEDITRVLPLGPALPAHALAIRKPAGCALVIYDILDFGDAKAPHIVGTFELPATARAVHLQPPLLYLACGEAGLFIIDLATPAAPVLHGGLGTDTAFDVKQTGDRLLLVEGDQFHVLPADQTTGTDLPVVPLQVKHSAGSVTLSWRLDLPGEAVQMRCLGRAGGQTVTLEPRFEGNGDWSAIDDHPHDPGTEVVYRVEARRTGAQTWHLLVERAVIIPASPSRLTEIFPIPANPGLTINYEIGRLQDADLTVFDLAGRRIARLARGPHPAGRYTVHWQGVDESGRAIAAGTYLLRLQTGDGDHTRKLSVVR